MALLASSTRQSGLASRCARCASLATRSITTTHGGSSFARQPTRPQAARCRAATGQLEQRRGKTWDNGSFGNSNPRLVNPSEYVQLDDSKPMPADGKEIAIIGGGLTGLTAAYYMASVVRPSTKITIYESSPRLGGWIKTDKVSVDVGGKQGIVNFERGPRSLSSLISNKSRYDDLVFYDLCIRLGLQPQTAPELPRYLFYPDHLVPAPTSIASLIPALFTEPLWRETLPSAVLGYLKFAWAGKPKPDDCSKLSIAQFIEHLCSGNRIAADNVLSAMVHGIYGGDIDKLSASTALYPMVQQMWHEHAHHKAVAAPTTVSDFWTLACFLGDEAVQRMARGVAEKKANLLHFGSGGLQTLTDALADALRAQPNVKIKTSTPVRRMEYARTEKRVRIYEKQGKVARYDKVYSTTTAQALAQMVPGKLASLQKFNSVSIMAVNLWFPEPNLKPPGFGYLIPRTVSKELNPHHALGVFFDSDIGINHPDEPEGTKLFVLFGGHHYEKPGAKVPKPEEAIANARQLLRDHLGIPDDLPCHAEANYNRNCIPQHYVGHDELVQDLYEEAEAQFEGRLSPIGGSFTRIGGMAALRDGWHAGTAGFDPSKPLTHKDQTNDWAESMQLKFTAYPQPTFVHHAVLGPVRTKIYPDRVRSVARVLLDSKSKGIDGIRFDVERW